MGDIVITAQTYIISRKLFQMHGVQQGNVIFVIYNDKFI
jgi:hypothetical protein